MILSRRVALPALLLLLLAVLGAAVVYAQLEGADRGIPPIDSATTLEITGIDVDVTAKNAEEARLEGWRQAQAKGWAALWAKTTGRPVAQAPKLPDSTLDGLVSGIIIEQEQIGPRRYIARLGLLFERARTGELLGVSGVSRRSAPLLVLPVMVTGSSYQSFEWRNPWQAAWARFRTGGSAIDYVRPTGSGIDPLLLNAAQSRRPGRAWWRMLLDQYGASDVIVPEVHMRRSYPGGPVLATFYAHQGPDYRLLGSFTLRVENSGAIPQLLDEGIRRLDGIYSRALDFGLLAPDASLTFEESSIIEELAARIEAATAAAQVQAPLVSAAPTTVPVGAATAFTLQVDTPMAAAVSQAEISVSRIPGVTSAITTSLALGGSSLMRVTFVGDQAAFAAALQAQGWSVSGAGTTLRIARPGSGPPPPQPDGE